MRILFLNRYAWPDLAATAQQLTDLAEHLAGRGHDVRVLCSTGRYRGEGDPLPPPPAGPHPVESAQKSIEARIPSTRRLGAERAGCMTISL